MNLWRDWSNRVMKRSKDCSLYISSPTSASASPASLSVALHTLVWNKSWSSYKIIKINFNNDTHQFTSLDSLVILCYFCITWFSFLQHEIKESFLLNIYWQTQRNIKHRTDSLTDAMHQSINFHVSYQLVSKLYILQHWKRTEWRTCYFRTWGTQWESDSGLKNVLHTLRIFFGAKNKEVEEKNISPSSKTCIQRAQSCGNH